MNKSTDRVAIRVSLEDFYVHSQAHGINSVCFLGSQVMHAECPGESVVSPSLNSKFI